MPSAVYGAWGLLPPSSDGGCGYVPVDVRAGEVAWT